jgi:hypothetical protein
VDRHARRWIAAWLGGSVLGVANGIVREAAYKSRVGERAANQISSATLAAALAAYFALLQRRWPLASTRSALEVGGVWAALTVAFEFGFGHYVDRKSWSELAENYDVRKGNLWPADLLWIAVGPATARSLASSR